MTKKEQMDMNRRQFLKRLGLGAGSAHGTDGHGAATSTSRICHD